MRKLFLALIVMTGLTATAEVTLTCGSFEAITSIKQEKKYKKIEVSEVSKEVLATITKNYGNYTIKEAHRADDGEYKLILTKDGIDTTVTCTSEGEIIKIY